MVFPAVHLHIPIFKAMEDMLRENITGFLNKMNKVECYHIGVTNTFTTAFPISRNSILKYLISDYETETNLNH